MDFVVIDVETANPDMASICQIGIASFRGGELVDKWDSLVDPQDWFSPFNVKVHGIKEAAVAGAPTLPTIEHVVRDYLESAVAVSHTPFDRLAVHQAFSLYDLEPPTTVWLDSARVARRTWTEVAQRGYGLANLCSIIGYEFQHHDALEDAIAAGRVLLAAIAQSGLGLEEWLEQASRPIGSDGGSTITRDGDPEGPLAGEVMVFTGALQIPRREAADLAAKVGCQVGANVTRDTSMLVVGDQDVSKFAGHDKSSKQRKAEQRIAEG